MWTRFTGAVGQAASTTRSFVGQGLQQADDAIRRRVDENRGHIVSYLVGAGVGAGTMALGGGNIGNAMTFAEGAQKAADYLLSPLNRPPQEPPAQSLQEARVRQTGQEVPMQPPEPAPTTMVLV